MSALIDLNSDLLGVVLQYCSRGSLVSLARAHRALTAELFQADSQQAHTWKLLVARDWGVPKHRRAATTTEEEENEMKDEPVAAASSAAAAAASPSPSPSPNPDNPHADDADIPAGLQMPVLLPGESWRGAYRRYCEHFGSVAASASGSYQRMASLWRRLFDWLEQHKEELPPIADSLATTFAVPGSTAAAQSTFAAGLSAAQGGSAATPRSHPSPSWDVLQSQLGEAQVEWRHFELQVRAQWSIMVAEEHARADAAEQKRQSKRERSSQAQAAAQGREEGGGGGSRSGSSATSSGSSSPSHAATRGPEPSGAGAAAASAEDAAATAAAEAAAAAGGEGLSVHFDNDLLCSLLLHDGQAGLSSGTDVYTGLFGFFSFYNVGVSHRLMPLEHMLELGLEAGFEEANQRLSWAQHALARQVKRRKQTAGAQKKAGSAAASATASEEEADEAEAKIDPMAGMELLMPLTHNPIEGAPCQFLVRSTDGSIVRRFGDGGLHEVAPSFHAFFERYVNDLERGVFGFSKRKGISRFPIAHDPTGSVCTTRGVRIQVSVLFVPEQSTQGLDGEDPRYFFTYHVRITHDGSTRLRARLVSRHWIIEDATGHVEEVQGTKYKQLLPLHRSTSAQKADDLRYILGKLTSCISLRLVCDCTCRPWCHWPHA
jgi:hypothetical protein